MRDSGYETVATHPEQGFHFHTGRPLARLLGYLDEWLESLRRGDRIRVGRWEAPFDIVRRYLVTGVFDAGRRRAIQHDALVTAMSQLTRWGAGASALVGDQADWREAREAISALMERFHRH